MDPGFGKILSDLYRRRLSGGGFEEHPGGGYRPDATAWAVLAFSAVGAGAEFIDPACLSLAQSQLPDGRIPLSPGHIQACWPTPLALMAWTRVRKFEEARERAVSFLLNFTGVHWEKDAESPMAHDTALKGWPWIAETHSWVEPTALAVIALRSSRRGDHPRVSEAVEMLLDRQLSGGGWNYGNTEVYGQQLRPMPDSTGIALTALSGLVRVDEVSRSLVYLSETLPRLGSPLSLSWGLLGLKAWRRPPTENDDLIARCLDSRRPQSPWTTTHLSLLLLAHLDKNASSIFQLEDKT